MRGHAGTAWHCSATSIRLDAAAHARPGDVRSQYQVTFGDRRTPPYSDDTARIAMEVFVFRSSRDVARCARAGIYVDEHQPVPGKPTKFMAYRKFGPHTIAYGLRRADAPGSVHGETGTYDTQLADGRILALGIAYTGHDSRIVEADLTRLAHQIAG